MVFHDARPAVRSAMRVSAYATLLTGVHRGLQRTARLLAGFIGGLRLRLGSHDRGPSTVGVGRGTEAHTPDRSSEASQGRSGIAGRVAGDAARVGGPGWLEVPLRAVVTAAQNQITVQATKLSFSSADWGAVPTTRDARGLDVIGFTPSSDVMTSRPTRGPPKADTAAASASFCRIAARARSAPPPRSGRRRHRVAVRKGDALTRASSAAPEAESARRCKVGAALNCGAA